MSRTQPCSPRDAYLGSSWRSWSRSWRSWTLSWRQHVAILLLLFAILAPTCPKMLQKTISSSQNRLRQLPRCLRHPFRALQKKCKKTSKRKSCLILTLCDTCAEIIEKCSQKRPKSSQIEPNMRAPKKFQVGPKRHPRSSRLRRTGDQERICYKSVASQKMLSSLQK